MAEKEGQLYVVDDILACKRVGGKFYYRIRWSGYGAADDTWEGKECFTALSLSYFLPRLNALEQLWLNSGADKRRRQDAPRKRTSGRSSVRTGRPKAGNSTKKTAATKQSPPTKSEKPKKGSRSKNSRAKGRVGRQRQLASS